MKANYGLLIGLVFAGLTPFSVAQVPIAPGVYACDGAAQAGPCNGGGSGGTSSSSSSPYGVVGYAHAAPKWADRWGAIATDATKAALGVAINVDSQQLAKARAISDCKSKGGINCKIQLAYHNQCAAMIVGNKMMNTWRAETIDEAANLGLSECNKDDSNCRVYYSGCSYPEQIQ